jgi:hypothetical protein
MFSIVSSGHADGRDHRPCNSVGYIGHSGCVTFVGGGQGNLDSQLESVKAVPYTLLFRVINDTNLVEKSSFFVPLSRWTAQSTTLDGHGFVTDCK